MYTRPPMTTNHSAVPPVTLMTHSSILRCVLTTQSMDCQCTSDVRLRTCRLTCNATRTNRRFRSQECQCSSVPPNTQFQTENFKRRGATFSPHSSLAGGGHPLLHPLPRRLLCSNVWPCTNMHHLNEKSEHPQGHEDWTDWSMLAVVFTE